MDYKTLSHNKYLLNYHFVFCPKFRFDVLQGDVETELKKCLERVCERYQYDIIEQEIMNNHVHLFLSLKPTVSPTDAIRTLKSVTAIELFKTFPKLKKFYGRCGSLWSSGYFVSTVGNASTETIKKYIQEQKNCS